MKLLSLTLALAALAPSTLAQASAVYEVRFDATWSAQSHPGAYPVNAHFSPLIGATHSDSMHFWQPGGIATNGIEVMAETGNPGPLRQEVWSAIQAGNAESVVEGGGASSPGSAMATFTVTEDYPLLTLVTMIAPSPDWFVGVDSLNLFTNGQWTESMVIPLIAWDSGTDSGPDFTSGNVDVSPHEAIELITDGPFTGSDPLGTFTITLISGMSETCNGDGGDQLGCSDCPCGNNAAQGTIGGCLNSVGASSRLAASGSASIGTSDLRMEANGLPAFASAVLTSGSSIAPANPASPCFGSNSGINSISLDGMRCAVQGVLRHGVRAADATGDIGATNAAWGQPNGFFQFAAFVTGETRHFQVVYRDDAAASCQTGQNTTQAISVTFAN